MLVGNVLTEVVGKVLDIYNLKKRAEGKKHNHALRCLARQMIKVIYRMLTEDRDYQIKKEAMKVA